MNRVLLALLLASGTDETQSFQVHPAADPGAFGLSPLPHAAEERKLDATGIELAGRKSRIGIRAALVAAKISGPAGPDASSDWRTSYGGGIFWTRPRSRVFIQPELLFLEKGVNRTFRVNATAGLPFSFVDDQRIRLRYLELPLLLKINLLTKGTLRPAVFLGPSVGLQMKASLQRSATFSAGAHSETLCCVASPVARLVALKMAEAVCPWSPAGMGGVPFRRIS